MSLYYPDLSDDALIDLLNKGQDRAFAEIYTRYWQVLWRFATRHLHDPDEAKDVLQEVFTSLWQNREVLVIQTRLSSYLYRATLNRVLKRSSHSKVAEAYRQQLTEGFLVGASAQAVESPDIKFETRELEKRLLESVSMMPRRMREVFEASRLEGLTHEEISDRFGISRETVKSQIKNAIKILRKRLYLIFLVIF